ncbi:hypothetical protein F5Y05DRAFT_409881 [Hypoxylon sp. FL0543]|nr:hypothetical protein F5Y05DRAFT_409881 [Hypoxylon sp. FL0543]
MALPVPYSKRQSLLSIQSLWSTMSGFDNVNASDKKRKERSEGDGTRDVWTVSKRRNVTADRADARDDNATVIPQRAPPNLTPQPAQQPKKQSERRATQHQYDSFLCPKCDQPLKTKATLKQHTDQVHIGVRCYWPGGCDAVLESEAALNRHLQEHSDAAGAEFTCNWSDCGRSYKYRETFCRHLRMHNNRERDRRGD